MNAPLACQARLTRDEEPGEYAADATGEPREACDVRDLVWMATPVPAPVRVRMKRVGPAGVPRPSYARPGDAGMDLPAVIRPGQTVWRGDREIDGHVVDDAIYLAPGERAAIPCGWAFAIPPGYEGQVRPRSSTSLKRGLRVPVGTVDSGYRGEVCCVAVNMTSWPVRIRTGDRLAQIVIAPVARAAVDEVDELDATERGVGGFGSTDGAA